MLSLSYSTAGLAYLSVVAAAAAATTTTAASAGGSFVQLADDVNESLNGVRQKVDSWNRSQGLTGALGIQSEYPELLRRVDALQSASANVASGDVDPKQLLKLVSTISGLLQSLSQKEGELSSVGAKTIGGSDIRQLQQPTIDIMAGVINAIASDCAKLQQLDPIATQISQAFADVDSVYDLQLQQFPTVPTCEASAGHSASAEQDLPVQSHTPQPPHIRPSASKQAALNGTRRVESTAATRNTDKAVNFVDEGQTLSTVYSTVYASSVPGTDPSFSSISIAGTDPLFSSPSTPGNATYSNATYSNSTSNNATLPSNPIAGPSLATGISTDTPAFKNAGSTLTFDILPFVAAAGVCLLL